MPPRRQSAVRAGSERMPSNSEVRKLGLTEENPRTIYFLVSSHRGAFRDRHRTRGGMRWTLVAPITNGCERGRPSRVVLAPRRWSQVRGCIIRGRRWQKSPVTGEITKQPLKPLRGECPGDVRRDRGDYARVLY